MGSKVVLKNSVNAEFTIEHSGSLLGKRINATDIVVAVDEITDFPQNPLDGDVCIVRNTARGGTFIYDATQSAVNNSGTIFNGWVRQYSGAVNVKWFGAKGDGIADDTLAIQKSINYLSNDIYIYAPEYSNGGTVFIPNGKFRVTDTIYLTRGVKLKGNLSSASFGYVPTNNSNSISVIFGDFTEENKIIIDTATYIVDTQEHVPSNSVWDGADVDTKVLTQTHAVAIEDICVYGNDVAMTAIRIISSPLASVNNVLINGGVDYGIIFQACWGLSFDNCNIIAKKVGAAIINSCYGFSSTGVYTSTGGASLDVSEIPYFYHQGSVGNSDINPLQVYTARVGIYISSSNGVLNSPINEQSAIGMVLRNSRVMVNSPHWEQLVYIMAFTYYSQVEFNSVTAIHANKKLMYAGTGSQINFTVANNSSDQYLDYFEHYSFSDSRAVIDGARKSGALDSIGSIRHTQSEYPAKAWAQFDGGLTPYIRYSKNIGSITRLDTGHLYIAFANPMPDTNYAVNATAGNFTYMAPGTISQITWGKPTVNGFEISVTDANNLPANANLISISVYR